MIIRQGSCKILCFIIPLLPDNCQADEGQGTLCMRAERLQTMNNLQPDTGTWFIRNTDHSPRSDPGSACSTAVNSACSQCSSLASWWDSHLMNRCASYYLNSLSSQIWSGRRIGLLFALQFSRSANIIVNSWAGELQERHGPGSATNDPANTSKKLGTVNWISSLNPAIELFLNLSVLVWLT